MRQIWQILKWIFFWYFLAPYYLFQKYVFKGKNRKLYAGILALVLVFIGFNFLTSSPDSSSPQPRQHYVVKKVGAASLAQAEKEAQKLKQEKAQKLAEIAKLTKEIAKQKRKNAQQAATNNSVTLPKTSSFNHYHSSTHISSSHQVNTAKTGKIIGNRNSKIYHLPGQYGYKMSSKNAVYFNSEQEAIRAGYRKAKR